MLSLALRAGSAEYTIIEKARISAVRAYKMLKTDHPQGEYALLPCPHHGNQGPAADA